MPEPVRDEDEILCDGDVGYWLDYAGSHENVPHPQGCGACVGYPFETRECIIVQIEAAEHALENAFFVKEADELRGEIQRLNNRLREIDARN